MLFERALYSVMEDYIDNRITFEKGLIRLYNLHRPVKNPSTKIEDYPVLMEIKAMTERAEFPLEKSSAFYEAYHKGMKDTGDNKEFFNSSLFREGDAVRLKKDFIKAVKKDPKKQDFCKYIESLPGQWDHVFLILGSKSNAFGEYYYIGSGWDYVAYGYEFEKVKNF